MTQAYVDLRAEYNSLFNRLFAHKTHDLALLLANYQKHRQHIDSTLARRDSLVFIAHSQGNLFMNQAYDYATHKTDATSVKAIHIAPASIKLNGEYTLGDTDGVIKLLSRVPSPNITMPNRDPDTSGHKLLETYLNPSLPAYNQIRTQLAKALNTVRPPFDEAYGAFNITASWDGSGDVDLYVNEPPDGKTVYNNSRDGNSGVLDIANHMGGGPERYSATCDSNRLATGNYLVSIKNLGGADERKAVITASSIKQGMALTRKVPVPPVGNPNDPLSMMSLPVMTIAVTKRPDGSLQLDAH